MSKQPQAPPRYQPGQQASIKFMGMEQPCTVVSGPVEQHTEPGYPSDRSYWEYTISLDGADGLDDNTVAAAESELF